MKLRRYKGESDTHFESRKKHLEKIDITDKETWTYTDTGCGVERSNPKRPVEHFIPHFTVSDATGVAKVKEDLLEWKKSYSELYTSTFETRLS